MATVQASSTTSYDDRYKPGYVGRKVKNSVPWITETNSLAIILGGTVALLMGYNGFGKVMIGGGVAGFLIANGLV